MKTCAAGALVTARSKRCSGWRPGALGMPICTGGSSARSSDSGRAGGLRSPVRASSAEISRDRPSGGGGSAHPPAKASASTASGELHFAPSASRRLLFDIWIHEQHIATAVLLQNRDRVGHAGKRAAARLAADGTSEPSISASLRCGETITSCRPVLALGAQPARALDSPGGCIGSAVCARAFPCAKTQANGCRGPLDDLADAVFLATHDG